MEKSKCKLCNDYGDNPNCPCHTPVSEVMEIPLTQQKVALINKEDLPLVSGYKWHFNHEYACNGSKNKIYMHRLIIGNPPKGMTIDHINRIGIDNRRENLRIVTPSQNMYNTGIRNDNTSGFKGVYLDKKLKGEKWSAQIKINKKQVYLGNFDKKEDAYKAYCDACRKYHGEFANYKLINNQP